MQAQPEASAFAPSQKPTSQSGFNWKWSLYAIAVIAVVLGLKYLHVQDLLKTALDWIGKLWTVGTSDFRRTVSCRDGIVRSRLGPYAGAGRVHCSAWPLVGLRFHQRHARSHRGISGGPVFGARCDRSEDRQESEVCCHRPCGGQRGLENRSVDAPFSNTQLVEVYAT